MRGRKPGAPELKIIAGTARSDREAPDAPKFDPVDDFPKPPQHLNPDGVAMWSELGPQLVAARVLQTVDLFILEQLCYAWQRFRKKAKADMDITAAEDSALKGLFSEFGMSPAARRRVTSGGEEKKGNRFAGRGKKPDEAAA
jgi:phage terminase small subunit